MYALRDRTKALEDKFAYDENLQFRAESRRNRLMGLPAASLLGSADAGAYAQDLVFSTLDGKAPHDIATKLRHDFDAADVDASAKGAGALSARTPRLYGDGTRIRQLPARIPLS